MPSLCARRGSYGSRSCACGPFAALALVCLIGITPAVAETVLRIANMEELETLDPHKTTLQGLHLALADDINDLGEIVGATFTNNGTNGVADGPGFALFPCDEMHQGLEGARPDGNRPDVSRHFNRKSGE
jgi:hypothetical protein